jgi:hypothetical protein
MKAADGSMRPFADVPSQAQLEQAGRLVVNAVEPQLILDDLFFVSGEIPRVTAFETGMQGQHRRTLDGQGWEPDPLVIDERFIAVSVKGKGVIVLTACSHAGVVNVMTHARDCFAGETLYGVLGGFHLSGGNERIIPETVAALRAFELKIDCRRPLHRLARGQRAGECVRRCGRASGGGQGLSLLARVGMRHAGGTVRCRNDSSELVDGNHELAHELGHAVSEGFARAWPILLWLLPAVIVGAAGFPAADPFRERPRAVLARRAARIVRTELRDLLADHFCRHFRHCRWLDPELSAPQPSKDRGCGPPEWDRDR